jgi:hypothetical protein
MRRLLDLVFEAGAIAVFVLCIERLARHWRRKKPMERRADRRQGRLRVRHQAHVRRVIFAVEGTLDEFGARMLACSIERVPASSTAVIDLSQATPIEGRALAVFSRIFSAGRPVRVRGLVREPSVPLPVALAA